MEVLSMGKFANVSAYILYYLLVLSILAASSYGISTAATVMAQISPLEGRHCIIIDAGHGGVDGGATSCTGILESQINLQISLRLNDLLHLLGYDTKMIRTEDISVYTEGNTIAAKKVSDLKNRIKTVNETEEAVLISIHQNYFEDGKYSGAQVFYNREGQMLSSKLQRELIASLGVNSKRQPKEAKGIYLMENVYCPAALIECGFLSNPEEEAKLNDSGYQKSLCCVIGAVLSRYLNT